MVQEHTRLYVIGTINFDLKARTLTNIEGK